MIVNRQVLLDCSPIENMLVTKERTHGVSHGLAEAGYDIRLKQDICFTPSAHGGMMVSVDSGPVQYSRFTIASAIERFTMPPTLVGVVHDKSTWARRGLSVFNTVIEPGWEGYLTLELVYHGNDELVLPAGCGIAQVLFSWVEVQHAYQGKYQNQADKPVSAVFEGFGNG